MQKGEIYLDIFLKKIFTNIGEKNIGMNKAIKLYIFPDRLKK